MDHVITWKEWNLFCLAYEVTYTAPGADTAIVRAQFGLPIPRALEEREDDHVVD